MHFLYFSSLVRGEFDVVNYYDTSGSTMKTSLSKYSNKKKLHVLIEEPLYFYPSIQFFTNSQQYKNTNIANFILAVPLEIN